jgi:hypothetical protein
MLNKDMAKSGTNTNGRPNNNHAIATRVNGSLTFMRKSFQLMKFIRSSVQAIKNDIRLIFVGRIIGFL